MNKQLVTEFMEQGPIHNLFAILALDSYANQIIDSADEIRADKHLINPEAIIQAAQSWLSTAKEKTTI